MGQVLTKECVRTLLLSSNSLDYQILYTCLRKCNSLWEVALALLPSKKAWPCLLSSKEVLGQDATHGERM
jgi:hypothetical protein